MDWAAQPKLETANWPEERRLRTFRAAVGGSFFTRLGLGGRSVGGLVVADELEASAAVVLPPPLAGPPEATPMGEPGKTTAAPSSTAAPSQKRGPETLLGGESPEAS